MKKIRLLSLFLAFVILLLNIPSSAFSVETEMAVTSNNSEEPDNYATDDEIFILEEDTSKRGRFEKHYLCSDGSYFSVTYPESVHYLNNENKWEDIDLTPEYDTDAEKYVKRSGSFGYSFGESASNANMVEIHSREYTISWGLEIATKAKENGSESVSHDTPEDKDTILPVSCVQAEISKERNSDNNSGKRYITDSKAFVLSDTSTKIKYSNYTEDCSISLEYTVYQDKIEEDIIINEKGAESFSMSMNIGNLVPVVNSDGSVFLTDEEGTVIFRIGIPYMVDSAFAVCSEITVKAEKTGSHCIITYSPDRTWMNSSDRVYPVVLDPSVSTNDYVSNIEDTYVEENSTVNHSSEQYLYINRNGNNKRKAIVRINQLPIVDEAMPIISAHLVLTAQSESTDFIDMKTAYLDTGLDFDEYDYSLSNFYSNTFVEYSYLEDGFSYVEFDISSHIYEMYEDEKWDEENGYDYNGDFVIGFEYENDTSYVPPFYSSDFTGVANRPKLIIRYGYSLPAGILNNSVYSFMNCGSGCYMSANGTNPSNNSNIYQFFGNGDGAELFQKFKLEYVPSTGGYLLRSMVSSSGFDKVVSINRGASNVGENMNICLSSPGDAIGQEWLIVPIDYNEFKIVPRANMSLAITSYGYANGSNAGTYYYSSGNIFVKEYDSDNFNQKWFIDDSDGNEICTDISRSVIETGTYYVSNYYSGKYLHRNTNAVNCARDKKAVLGENTVQWKIVNLGDGYCTIQRADLPGYYLARDVNSNNSVKVIYRSSDTVADKCKWSIRYSSGGYLVKNFNGKYLTYNSSDSTVTLNNLSSSGTDSNKKQQWRIVEEDYYVELGYGVSFNDISLDIGESKSAVVNKSPSNATWSNHTDYEYSIVSGAQYVSFNTSSNKFSGVASGTAELRAEHKTTGILKTFTIKVNKNAIIIIPGILGSELYAGQDYGCFKTGMPLISTSMEYFFQGINTITEDFNSWKQENEDYLTNTSITMAEYADCLYDFLRCNNDGTPNKSVIVKKYKQSVQENELLYYTDSCGTGDLYSDLYSELQGNADICNKYCIELFSYDWRLSNSISANSLNSFISSNNYDKVILIAHSMGGLVASAYLALGSEQQDKVVGLYYLASPLLGTPEMANVLGNLDFSRLSGGTVDSWMSDIINIVLSIITLTPDALRSLMCNYQSIYELMPSEYYFSLANHFYMAKQNTLGNVTNLNYSQSCFTLEAHYCYPFHNTLNNNAISFHNNLFNLDGTHISENVNAFYLYGVGTSTLNLLKSIEIFNYLTASYDYSLVPTTFTTDGDSMVPKWSAALNGVPNNNRIYCCSGNNSTHSSILSNDSVLSFIKDSILGVYVYNPYDTSFIRGYN